RYPVPTQGALQSSTTDFEELGYDPAGNVVSRRLRDGQTVQQSFDALGRLTLIDLPNSSYNEHDRAFGYDLLGRMTRAETLGHTLLTFGYDALGRMTSEFNVHGTKTSAYDLAGRRTRLTHPDGFFVDYDYNVTGEVTAIRENGATSGPGVLAVYSYDPSSSAGQMGIATGVTFGNGTFAHLSYDAALRPSGRTIDLAGTVNDLTLGFTYNPASQIVWNSRTNDAYSFTALATGIVAEVPNGLNQLVNRDGAALTYDARGNLLSAPGADYMYTAENRLTARQGVGYMDYDALGRLRWVYDYQTTRYDQFDYDGHMVIAENRAASENGSPPLPPRRRTEPARAGGSASPASFRLRAGRGRG
nr:RHS repeat protein [Pseudomonadota bacterium]